MDSLLLGRVAVVTGGGGGFGRVLARALAEAGAHVLVVDHDGPGASDTVDLVAAAGGAAEAMTIDVTDDAGIDRVVTRAHGHSPHPSCWSTTPVGGRRATRSTASSVPGRGGLRRQRLVLCGAGAVALRLA